MLRKYELDPSHVIFFEHIVVRDSLSYEEQHILDRKEQVLWNKAIPLVYVQLKHHSLEESTWEREADVRDQYLELFS